MLATLVDKSLKPVQVMGELRTAAAGLDAS